jgi:hypothetical protein
MKNLKPKPLVFLLFLVFAGCFLFVACTSGVAVEDVWTALIVAYKTIPLMLILGALFVGYGWRLRIFRSWLVPFPDLNGTWEGTIKTTWKNPDTGETPGPIPVVLTVKQSFAHISCVMRTAEMISRSYFADFWIDQDQQIRKLGYCYQSSPRPSFRHRSSPHEGTIIFEVIGNPAAKLDGVYWSSRATSGELSLTFRCPEVLQELPSDLPEHPVSGIR